MAQFELALFSGAGGGILGGKLLGWRCVGAVEIEHYSRAVLHARQRDGLLPWFPIWDDIRTFRSDNPECAEYFEWLKYIRGKLVITGGFPCQDISAAGKGAGLSGTRSGLWFEMRRVISEVRPAHVLVENSPLLRTRGLWEVLKGFAEMGYDARWGVLGACHVGAPHLRERIWILAHASSKQAVRFGECGVFAANSPRLTITPWNNGRAEEGRDGVVRKVPPGIPLMDDGVAAGLERLRSTGNGQVPAVVKLAWETFA